MRILKRIFTISLILLIQSIIIIYRIICQFYNKYNMSIKKFIKRCDKALRESLV